MRDQFYGEQSQIKSERDLLEFFKKATKTSHASAFVWAICRSDDGMAWAEIDLATFLPEIREQFLASLRRIKIICEDAYTKSNSPDGSRP